jgi:hypothetical protein
LARRARHQVATNAWQAASAQAAAEALALVKRRFAVGKIVEAMRANASYSGTSSKLPKMLERDFEPLFIGTAERYADQSDRFVALSDLAPLRPATRPFEQWGHGDDIIHHRAIFQSLLRHLSAANERADVKRHRPLRSLTQRSRRRKLEPQNAGGADSRQQLAQLGQQPRRR